MRAAFGLGALRAAATSGAFDFKEERTREELESAE
jgi:hypothetical protein